LPDGGSGPVFVGAHFNSPSSLTMPARLHERASIVVTRQSPRRERH